MKRILPLLLALILMLSLAMTACADQLISRSITVEVVANTEQIDETESTEVSEYSIVYVPGSGASGSTKTYNYTMKSAEDTDTPKPEIKSASALGFTNDGATFSYWSGSDGNQYAPGSAVDLASTGGSLTLTGVWAGEKNASITIKDDKGNVIYSGSDVQGWTLDLSTVSVDVPDDKELTGWKTSSGTVLGVNAVIRITGDDNVLTAVFKAKDPEKREAEISISKYITNKRWEKDGKIRLFKAGETVDFNIVVTNTGDKPTTDKIIVYDTLKGVKIKSGSGYSRDDGNAIIKAGLGEGRSVTIKATYTIKSSDLSKHKLVNMAYAYYRGHEIWDACRIPIRHRDSSDYVNTTTITVYADSSLSQPLNQIISDFELDYTDYSVNVVYGTDLTTISSIAAYGGSDVLITVGKDHMDFLDLSASTTANPNRNNRIISSTRITPVQNRAALVGRSGTVVTFRQLSGVLSSGQAKLAISTNANEMASTFAQEAATSLAIDLSTLKATGAVIECANSAEVAQAVQSGKADLGIMSGSDAVAYGMTTADVANDGICTPVSYPAAVLRGSTRQSVAQTFVNYLRSTDARYIFNSFGYTAM